MFPQAARAATASPPAVSSETTARVSGLQDEVSTLKAQLEDKQFQLEAALAKMQALQAQLEQAQQDSRDVTVHAEALARELAQATAEVTRLRTSRVEPDEAVITDLSMRLFQSGVCNRSFTCNIAYRHQGHITMLALRASFTRPYHNWCADYTFLLY